MEQSRSLFQKEDVQRQISRIFYLLMPSSSATPACVAMPPRLLFLNIGLFSKSYSLPHCKKRLAILPSSAGKNVTNQTLPGEDGKIANLFLQFVCFVYQK
jgi:hypothetical protein